LWESLSRSQARARRSSSQPASFDAAIAQALSTTSIGGLPLPRCDEVDVEAGERPRRRPGDVAPGQVVDAVVAVAPDQPLGLAVLDDAVEMGAGGGEGAEVGLRRP
jgi:hypothetical protein